MALQNVCRVLGALFRSYLPQLIVIFARLVKLLCLVHLSAPRVLLALTHLLSIRDASFVLLGFTLHPPVPLRVRRVTLVSGHLQESLSVISVLPVIFHSVVKIIAHFVLQVLFPLLAPLRALPVHPEHILHPEHRSVRLALRAHTRSSALESVPTVRPGCIPVPVRLYAVHAPPEPRQLVDLLRVLK